MLAASRLYLDNIPHIQASWFSEGKKVGQLALHFGADDFGGTLYEENVHAEAGFVNTITVGELVQLIHESGFDAFQRSTHYELVKLYPRSEKMSWPSMRNESSLRKNKVAV
jgi:cyclic dehypoxanthinyl futalosine synthase